MDLKALVMDIDQEVTIHAAADRVFGTLLSRFSDRNTMPGDHAMPMVLEAWPGGRWYRDLGDDAGHFWGLVQVIKPPTLLEIAGPMFMSYPVAGHLQIRLTQEGEGTRLRLRHRAFGLLEDEHTHGAVEGWSHYLDTVKKDCE